MHLVEAHGLTKWFGGIRAVEGLDLRVPKGISGLIGPNGAGKTTTIHMLLGFLKPDDGEAYILGFNCWREAHEIKRRVGVLLEDARFPGELTGEEYIRLMAKLHGVGDARVKRVMRWMGVWWAKDMKIAGYSAGMLRRLGLARALVGEPELVILDEPTANLDPMGRLQLLERIKMLNEDEGVHFFISSHILPELEQVCHWAALMVNGRVAEQGSLRDLAERHAPKEYEIMASNCEALAKLLEEEGLVEEVAITRRNTIRCSARDPMSFYRELPRLLYNAGLAIMELRPVHGLLTEVFRKVVATSN